MFCGYLIFWVWFFVRRSAIVLQDIESDFVFGIVLGFNGNPASQVQKDVLISFYVSFHRYAQGPDYTSVFVDSLVKFSMNTASERLKEMEGRHVVDPDNSDQSHTSRCTPLSTPRECQKFQGSRRRFCC